MIFKPLMVEKVLAGVKTETRRPASQAAVDGHEECRYVVGKDYALQPGRGKNAVDRIQITEISLELLFQITDAAARREGFDDRKAFLDYWAELYGSAPGTQPVWVLTFRLWRPE